MKKLIFMFMVCFMVFAMSGCGAVSYPNIKVDPIETAQIEVVPIEVVPIEVVPYQVDR